MMILGLRLNLLRAFLKSSRHIECFNSTVVTNVGVHLSSRGDQVDKSQKLNSLEDTASDLEIAEINSAGGRKSRLVAAAFAAMGHADSPSDPATLSLDDRIKQAKTVDELLNLVGVQILTKVHGFKIFSILSNWTSTEKVRFEDLERDPRFIKLCTFLNKSISKHLLAARGESGAAFPDIVSDVSNEELAAKLSSTLTLPQLVKVLYALAMKQKRPLSLIRSLVFNITESKEELDIKLCADVLYSLASLNYPDEILLCRVATDLSRCIQSNKKPPIIKSIFQSLGMLKYRDTELLDHLSNWILEHLSACRPQDLVAVIQTLGSVNYKPSNEETFPTILPIINKDQALNDAVWLKIVWSLTVLGEATSEHVSSVLSSEFIDKLLVSWGSLPVPLNLKLLQINGYAKLVLKNSQESLLPSDSALSKINILRTKEKQVFVNGVFAALANLLPSSSYLTKDVDTGFGFLIDGVCRIEANMTPLAMVDKITGKPINGNKGTKIAILVHDYHDFCRGSRNELDGSNSLCLKLAELSGYKVVSVPYKEFNLSDKLPTKVQYLEKKIKSLVKNK